MNDQVSATGTHTCPTCAHEIVWDWTCHTWFNGTTWMSSLGCDSAVRFRCNNWCPWEYAWGLNPGNPRAEANEANRPAWLTGDPEWDRSNFYITNMPAGVRSWDEANQ